MKDPNTKELRENYINNIQWLATLAVFLPYLQLGLSFGWASPNFAWLLSKESPIQATTSDISWIISLSAIAPAVGAIIGSICMEYMGSRKLIFMTYFFISISWICLLLANSIEWIYASRIIGATPYTIISSSCPIYLGEISPPKSRGALISLAHTGSSIGLVLGTIAETYLPKKISTSIYLAAVLVGIILTLWLKDTPFFLMKKNDLKGAIKSIEFYHSDKDTTKELEEIKSFVENNKSQKLKHNIRELWSPVGKRLILLVIILYGMSVLSGYGILLNYMEIIFRSAKFDFVKPQEVVIYIAVVKVIVCFAVVKLIDKLGRKFLITISSVGTSIAMFALGLHFYLLSVGIDGKSLQWLPVASIIMFLTMFPVGYMAVPGAVLSEMFPQNMKSMGVFVAAVTSPILGFIATKSFQPFVDFAGEQYAFWTHSLMCLIAIPCVVFLMIETKGKSFYEIQNELQKKWHS